MSVDYFPPPTVSRFINSRAFSNFIIGPFGSGKTTGMLFKIVSMAREQRRGPDGLRRFRAVIVRNTGNQLQDTTLKSWFTWFPEGELGNYEKTNRTFNLCFDDVRCEVMFRPLDTPDDVRRLLSLDTNVIAFDEFREIHPEIFSAATGRVGRYPSKKDGGPYKDDGSQNYGVFGASNPPAEDDWWGTTLTEPPGNMDVFWQPSGLSQEAENLDNLPADYYENLCEGRDEAWIKVYVHGKLGASLSGKPVYRSFNSDTHVAKSELRPMALAAHPLLIGLDFGLTPACTFNQVDAFARLLTYDECVAEGMGILRFVREKLKPILAARFPGYPVIIIGDPAGAQRAQTDERTAFDIVRQEGLRIVPARTNALQARISAVDKLLTRTVDNKPGRLIDPRCKHLISALRGKYRYKIRTNGEIEPTPEKNQWSHIADADQYASLHADGSETGADWRPVRREVSHVSAAGWT